MSEQWDDQGLARAFQALADSDRAECSEADTALVWEAVHGTLDPEARRALIARLPEEPALAEAWRVAQAFGEPRTEPAAMLAPGRWRATPWLAAAAIMVLGLTATLLVSRPAVEVETTRSGEAFAVESLLAADAVLPRDTFVLRWRPGPEGARYQVRVTTVDLRVVATVRDLDRPEHQVPASALADVPAGSQVLWQVEVTLPSGARVTSETFVARIQ